MPVNGIELNVASAGSGPPVILLHGFPDRWQLWRHQLQALVQAGHQVIAPDLRGFGESDRPTEVAGYRMPTLIGDVVGILKAFGLDRADVIGHDWGAGLAWQLAIHQPALVNRLAVLSVGHGGSSVAAGIEQKQLSWYLLWFQVPGVAERVLPANDWDFFRSWAGSDSPDGSARIDRQVADLSRPGALTAGLNWYRANISAERYVLTETPTGPTVSCPTLAIWSSGDRFLNEAQLTGSRQFVKADWRYERIEDADHWIPVSAPRRVSELLVDFLS